MWPDLKDTLKKFWGDPVFFRKTMRSVIFALAAGGLAYGDKIAAVLPGSERAVHVVKVASVVSMGLVLMFGGGDSTLDTIKKDPGAVQALLDAHAASHPKEE